MKNSLSFKLVFIIASTILVSSLITTVLVNSYTTRSFRSYTLDRDRNTAYSIAMALSSALEQDRFDETLRSMSVSQNRAQKMSPRSGMMTMRGGTVYFVIADPSGMVLRESPPVRDLKNSFISRELLEDGSPYFDRNQDIAGYVLAGSMLGGPLSEHDGQSLRSLLKGILYSALLAAFLASIIGSLALQRVLKPLKSLNRGVRHLSRGDYTYQVELPRSGDELSQLAEGFNEMARSLYDAEQWKKQIISDTAHELRTPVSLIMGNLEMMMEGVYQPDEKRLRSLYEESSLLAELIKDLQVLSNTEATSAELEKESFSPDELVALTAEGFQAVAREKQLTIEVDTAFASLWEGDRRKIQQVLKNILSNAVRYTPEKGQIVLRTRRFKDSFMLEVEDSGPGIPETERIRVFDRFYRMDKSRNRGDGGSGLGLAISQAIINLHGGSIEALEGKKGGALIRIIFPL